MKPPSRLFVPDVRLTPGDSVALPTDEARHVRSRRLRDGEGVVLLDGRGAAAEAVLIAEGKEARVVSVTAGGNEPDRAVHVLLCAAEPSRVEWAIEKGTECGAASFTLVAAARSQAIHVSQCGKRLPRFRRIAVEAMKQCGRSTAPEVHACGTLDDALRAAVAKVVVALPGATSGEVPEGPLSIVIGPEGGFSEEERALFCDAGAVSMSLGPRILRLETAVVVSLARLVDFPRT